MALAMPHRYRLLPERGGVGAEAPGALQRDRFEVEGPREHHRPIKAGQGGGVFGEVWKAASQGPVRRQDAAATYFEAGDHGKRLFCHSDLRSVVGLVGRNAHASQA